MAEAKKDMSFLEHLEELRRRLVRAVLAVIVGVIVIVFFHDFVINDVIMGPRKADFITYRAFCAWSHQLGLEDQLCLSPPNFTLQSTTMSGNMNADILVCLVGGLIIAFPFIFWQIWGFIKPGLKEREVSAVNGIVFFVSLLFFFGVAFGYFVLAPLSIQFLGNYQFADVENNATVLSYLKLTTSLVFGTGLLFQLPILMYFLAKIGLVSSAFLKKYRKHAFVVNLIIAAVLTPPDVTSQLLVAMPILLLYELSIWIAGRVEKKQEFS
ncbi:MAG: twin-arginine translocase subunit TatC [Flavobacteriales bacterium]|nr:twin-arginine translocase subunit TatC [Flavobacteriales bacterium]